MIYTIENELSGKLPPLVSNLLSIEVIMPPAKTDYEMDESFDKDGMVVLARYENGTSKTITNYITRPVTFTAPGVQSVLIQYTEKDITKTTNVTVKVAFDWGAQDEVGDATWWSNLRTWVQNGSTEEERAACLGMTKKVSLSSQVLGATSATMQVIGYDIDLAKSLTFQTANPLPNYTYFRESLHTGTAQDMKYNGSLVESLCTDFANRCNAKDSLYSITKQVCDVCNGRKDNSVVNLYSNKVWLLSECEANQAGRYSGSNQEWASGGAKKEPYQYYVLNYDRKSAWWTRSRSYNSNRKNYAVYISSGSSNEINGEQPSVKLAPAFVIG